jgi:hypothetical protein
MLAFRTLSTLLLATALTGTALAAGPKLICGQASGCPAGVLSDVRGAVDSACPCGSAASAKAYAKCWKPVVRGFVDQLGKTGFPKACRKEVARVLGTTTCGRSGFALCRKKGGGACTVVKTKKCKDIFPTGSAFRTCADACDGLAALPFPSTMELASSDLGSLAPDPGDGTLTFDAAPPSLDGVAVGNVIVAGVSPSTPAGLLRAVLAVERNGSQLVLRTGQAPIQLAYSKLHVNGSGSTPVTAAGGATAAMRRNASPVDVVTRLDFGTKKDFNYVLFDGDGDEETKNDQIAVDGDIGGGFDYDFGLDVDWGAVDKLPDVVSDCLKSLADILVGDPPKCSIDELIPEARVTFVVMPQVNANTNVHGAALLAYEKEVELASETLPPIIVGPLVFVPKADVTAELSGGASGMFSTGLHGSAVFQTSVTVSSKQTSAPQFKEPELVSHDFGPNDTQVTLQAFAKVGVGATLNLLLFGVTGPYATAKPYGAIEANILSAPCWNLHAGLEATLGIKVTSPALPLIGSVTLVDWQAPNLNPLDLSIADGGCEMPPGGGTLPPGAGPDAERLAMPTYTPWSRSWDSPGDSPVDGSLAATPENSVGYSELQRTIDGRYVRSGYGVKALTKLDDTGALTWARELALDGIPFQPLRVRSARDATMFVAASLPGTAPIVLAKIAQDGSAVEALAWDVPLDVCSVDLTALAVDGAGGAWIVGRCIGDPRSFVLHATASGSTFRLLGDLDGLRVNVVEPIGDDLFLAGSVTEGGDALVAFRLRADGTLAYAKRYDGCDEAPDAIPSAAIVGSQGEVTIAGSGGAQHNGLLLRLVADGSVGFAAFPGFGFGAADVFLLDSFVELPTTGYVAGGSVVNLTGDEPESVPSTALIGFDAVGNVLWANRFTFGTTGAYSNSGHVAVHLADDGGVVATTLLADALDPFTGGRLWAFKPFAKDGSIDFAPGTVTTMPLGITNLACSMRDSDLAATIDSRDVPSRAVTVTSTPVGLTQELQTGS